ncbi:condensation domain-containing protein [Actinosynnema sp. NPDC020468]|uniref:condensation domain-containing protein n=1 Tax=Actinosynnema sp. NPDC020468 TaxID=3154488 RepID=UPI0033E7A9F4
MAPESAAYNMAWSMRVLGPLDPNTLARAITEVAARHDLLRSRFTESDGTPRRVVDAAAAPRLVVRDAAGSSTQPATPGPQAPAVTQSSAPAVAQPSIPAVTRPSTAAATQSLTPAAAPSHLEGSFNNPLIGQSSSSVAAGEPSVPRAGDRGNEGLFDNPLVEQSDDQSRECRDGGPSAVGGGAVDPSALARAEVAVPFRLEHEGPVRVVLVRVGVDDAVLVFVVHHIAMDFGSLVRVVREVLDAYRGELTEKESGHTYADFVAAERGFLDSDRGRDAAEYWRTALVGAPTSLELPFDRPRPARPRFRGAVHAFQLPPDVVTTLGPTARALKVTPVRHLIGVFQALLHRHSAQREFLLGCDAQSALSLSHRGVVGYFTNRLLLRARCVPGVTFRDLARAVGEQLSAATAHGDYPFALLRHALGLSAPSDATPLATVAVSMISVDPSDPLLALATREDGHEVDHAGLRLVGVDVPQQAGQFDLTLEVIRSRADVHCALKYDTDLFDRTTAERLGDHYVRLLRAAATDPDRPVAAVPLMDETERARLLAFATGGPARGERS